MRKRERLAKLRRLAHVPRIEEGPHLIDAWVDAVKPMMTGANWRELDGLLGGYRNTGSTSEFRKSLIPRIEKAVLQEIHDLQDAGPDWTVPWTFWLVVATLIVALLAWLFPRSPVDAGGHNLSLSAASPAAAQPPPKPQATASTTANPVRLTGS